MAETRQEALATMLQDALKNTPSLVKAMQLFQIGEAEYLRALAGYKRVEIISSATTNPGGDEDAYLDRHKEDD